VLGFVVLSVLLHVLGIGLAFSPPTLMVTASDSESRLSVVLKSLGASEPSLAGENITPVSDQPTSAISIAKDLVTSRVKSAVPTDKPRQSERTESAQVVGSPVQKSVSHSNQSAAAGIAINHPQSDYRATGLDPPPTPLHDIEPEYPTHQGLREGVVVLRLLINEKGIVDEAIVVRSFPPGVFDSSAVVAFGSAKFSPGMFLGLPVKSQLTVEVEFMPTNRGAAVSGRAY
jgi:TonB family protein